MKPTALYLAICPTSCMCSLVDPLPIFKGICIAHYQFQKRGLLFVVYFGFNDIIFKGEKINLIIFTGRNRI